MRRSMRVAAVAAAGLLALSLGAVTALRGAAPADAATTSGGVKIAYFTQWGIYQNLYYPKNMDTQGVASKLNFVEYAFENIDPVNKTCFETTAAACDVPDARMNRSPTRDCGLAWSSVPAGLYRPSRDTPGATTSTLNLPALRGKHEFRAPD